MNKQDIHKIPFDKHLGMNCPQLYFFALNDLLVTLTSPFRHGAY